MLAHALDRQFGLGDSLKRLINQGKDLHRIIAAAVLNKDPADVTKGERNSAKPVSFGRPGGMGPSRLQAIAKASYGIELGLPEVEERIEAYHRLCPELNGFLNDESDTGLKIASVLGLTGADYDAARGRRGSPGAEALTPQPWLGGMLLKVLREEAPVTQQGSGRPYTPEEMDFFWDRAQSLSPQLEPPLREQLRQRRASLKLWAAVRDWAGRRPVFTLTGRLRAGATFCSSRNCIFQGPAADGAVLGLWKVWRDGFAVVNFVHDQVVVEVAVDESTMERAADVERLMRAGMEEVVPGMLVKVETVVTRSLSKLELDPRFAPSPADPARASPVSAA